MRMLTFAIAALALLAPAMADEDKKTVLTDIKEIELSGLSGIPTSKIDRPVEIATAEELKKTFGDEKLRGEIAKKVDFATQKLLYFAWAGSRGDRLTPVATMNEGEVVFQFKRGLTRDLRAHWRLFVMPRETTWRFAIQK